MPITYKCKSCNLTFSIGWYHYHRSDSGYGSATLFICKDCGTPHEIEIALRDRGDKYYYSWQIFIDTVPHLLRTRLMKYLKSKLQLDYKQVKNLIDTPPILIPGPIGDEEKDKIVSALSNIEVAHRVEPFQKHLNRIYGPLQKDRLKSHNKPVFNEEKCYEWADIKILGPRTGPCGELSIELQKCGCCGSIGSLVAELPANYESCPHCKKNTLEEIGGFVT